MDDFNVLMTGGLLDQLGMKVDEIGKVHRVPTDNGDDFVASVAGSVDAICHSGHAIKIDGDLMDRLPNLKLISNFGVGYDAIDAEAAAKRGLIVTNTPDVLTEEVADTALGLLLMTVRELGKAETYLRAGHWATDGDYPLTEMSLQGRSVGIVGLGRIGAAIAKRCEAFNLPISYFGRSKKSGFDYAYYDSATALASSVDTLIVVTPGTPETENLINADVLNALGPSGVVINVARGSVVDETALKQALKDKTIAAAGLDVMWNEPKIDPELMEIENLVLLPHVGSASWQTRRAMGQLVIDNLKSLRDATPPLTPVAETPFSGWK
ncbi:MAG: 2-hydroxyacid dehydrogenase [Pseudomonadota bacterium]